MKFTIRDLIWLTAVVALAVGWWLDNRRYDWSIKSAQMRKDYYNFMSDLARSETEKAIEKQKQLSDALQHQREKSDALESEPNHSR
jgi:hypothetical protein